MKSPNFWYRPLHPLSLLLLPLSWLFYRIVVLRRFLYQKGILKVVYFPVPIIVVGNITIGGTGKTPLVMWLAKALQEKGFHPGIVSRGYGVKTIRKPCIVETESDVNLVGDEPLLMAQHLDCPIVVCADRTLAVNYLLNHHYCNVIISDDGLQHYRMDRDVEIVVIDENRLFGNKRMLPAGTLREPLSRLESVDFLVLNCENLNLEKTDERVFYMRLMPKALVVAISNRYVAANSVRQVNVGANSVRQVNVGANSVRQGNVGANSVRQIMKNETVHAVAGIGNPDRFFRLLKKLGFSIIQHEFPDHHVFKRNDIFFNDEKRVIMTEKDAIKCREIVDDRHWFLSVAADVDYSLTNRIIELIITKKGQQNV